VAALDARPPAADGERVTLAVGAGERGSEDARNVASLYPSASLLVGQAATGERVLASAGSHAIVHVSAPVISSRSKPLMSRLVVADDAAIRHSGLVSGGDISAQPMTRTRLVVLSEIETSSSHRSEGTLSMARAFMAAGVPAVVGTLPGANENATRNLLIGFHRAIAGGASAEQALHQIQRNAIQQNGRRLGAWTALVLYGSDR
jgi:CHAT domain-containing protein